MLPNAYFLAKFCFDTAENEPAKKLQKICKLFLQILPIYLLGTSGGASVIAAPMPARSGATSRVSMGASCCCSCLPMLQPTAQQNFAQNFVRFRLYRRRSLQENTRLTAFCKIYQIIQLIFLKFGKILQFEFLQIFIFAKCLLMLLNFHENC